MGLLAVRLGHNGFKKVSKDRLSLPGHQVHGSSALESIIKDKRCVRGRWTNKTVRKWPTADKLGTDDAQAYLSAHLSEVEPTTIPLESAHATNRRYLFVKAKCAGGW